jgi:hypothetical protein
MTKSVDDAILAVLDVLGNNALKATTTDGEAKGSENCLA